MMELHDTPISDLFVLEKPVYYDDRGRFTRLFAADVMSSLGRPTDAIHVNSSCSKNLGTLRGIHFQYPPDAETKIVACTAGSIWDVAVDLRPNSSTQFHWYGVELTPENGLSMVIPEGFGHGFITLEPNSTAVYVVSKAYAPENESGARYDDAVLAIDWPIAPTTISDKDRNWVSLSLRGDELASGFSG